MTLGFLPASFFCLNVITNILTKNNSNFAVEFIWQ